MNNIPFTFTDFLYALCLGFFTTTIISLVVAVIATIIKNVAGLVVALLPLIFFVGLIVLFAIRYLMEVL